MLAFPHSTQCGMRVIFYPIAWVKKITGIYRNALICFSWLAQQNQIYTTYNLYNNWAKLVEGLMALTTRAF